VNTIRYQIVRYEYEGRPARGGLVNMEELARLARLHPEMLRRLVQWGLVEPEVWEPELVFQDTVVPRIWRIMRIRRDLGVNWAGLGVVLELLDRIEELEREVSRLRERL
jgi:DNA-binding transcriptional MerR regulator